MLPNRWMALPISSSVAFRRPKTASKSHRSMPSRSSSESSSMEASDSKRQKVSRQWTGIRQGHGRHPLPNSATFGPPRRPCRKRVHGDCGSGPWHQGESPVSASRNHSLADVRNAGQVNDLASDHIWDSSRGHCGRGARNSSNSENMTDERGRWSFHPLNAAGAYKTDSAITTEPLPLHNECLLIRGIFYHEQPVNDLVTKMVTDS